MAKKKIYFLGIGGTGMAPVAGLMKAAGHSVCGSDAGIYPPMSIMLEKLNIPVCSPYSPENLQKENPELVVVANSLSRGNSEIEYMLEQKIPHTSFPKLLGDEFLKNFETIVVSGTHGKTTTSTLLAYCLDRLGVAPGFLLGGLPRDFPLSFRLGKNFFVIEGDEYDTAFFDKGSKFLHYHPRYLLLNNLEFDHADIFKDLDAIKVQFAKLLRLVPSADQIIANIDNPGVRDLLESEKLLKSVKTVSAEGGNEQASVRVLSVGPTPDKKWKIQLKTNAWSEFTLTTRLFGRFNAANIAQVIACIELLVEKGALQASVKVEELVNIFQEFRGVKRRMDYLGVVNGVDVFEDFAHHPTAVASVIGAFKEAFPSTRLLVAFEPRNATSRRNIFQESYSQAFSEADLVFIGRCPEDKNVEISERMNTEQLAQAIGKKAKSFSENANLLRDLKTTLKKGDTVVFMSSGDFSGIQHRLVQEMAENRDKAQI